MLICEDLAADVKRLAKRWSDVSAAHRGSSKSVQCGRRVLDEDVCPASLHLSV